MTTFASDAEKLSEKMIYERRALVRSIANGAPPSLEDLQRLAAIESTIALASNIKGDEVTRAGLDRYDESLAAGTLDNKGFERELAPPEL
jgi:hypothetical protein